MPAEKNAQSSLAGRPTTNPGRLFQAARVRSSSEAFCRLPLEDDGCKGAGQFAGANPLTHGDEELVCCSIVRGSAAEGNSPEVIEDNRFPVLVSYRTNKLPVNRIERIDGAVDGVV